MAITPLPTPPSRQDPANFSSRADAFFGALADFSTQLSGTAAAAGISFLLSGTGAAVRSVFSKLSDTVSVRDFGVVGDGVVDDTAAMQAAINFCASTGRARKLVVPGDMVVYLTSSLLIPKTASGQVLEGDSPNGVYFKTPSGSTFPILKVAGSYTRISGILFRPGGAGQTCVQLYGPNSSVIGNRFLAASNDQGSAIQLLDVDPDTGLDVNGAYTYHISRNVIGVALFAFLHGIEDVSTRGIQACKIKNNSFVSNNPVKMSKGGANVYRDNVCQSSTMGGTGSGLDLGTGVVSEKISGNYFEGYAQGILLRQTTNTYQAACALDNHFDACTIELNTLGTTNYVFENEAGARFVKGWKLDYSNSANATINGPTGGTAIATYDDTNKALKVNKIISAKQDLKYSASNQTLTPTSRSMRISGNGAAFTGCVLGIAGVQDGQELRLTALSWPVTLTNTNARFENDAATMSLGNTSGFVQSVQFEFDSVQQKWIQVTKAVTY